MTAAALTNLFYQPFAQLIDTRVPFGQQPVNQLRACIEILRKYFASHQARAGIVARWAFDEGSGTSAADATGNGHTATLQGPTWSPGRSGSTLTFDGEDDIVAVLASPALTGLTNNFSLAFWANPRAAHEIDPESTSGASGTGGQCYAIGPQQGGTAYGSPEHAGVGVSVGVNGVSIYEHSDSYLPAVLVYQGDEIDTWTHSVIGRC